MMNLKNSTTTALAVSALTLALLGCQEKEGPAESAGKEIDKAAQKAGEQIEKAGDNIQDAAEGK
ncbi:hypothetical protein [Candidatus Nitrotoga sp. M5]|uniref:hypothetical protein n=1 Tax=Candidatus Nitrotoga sp. M5 TaxID=2890409 RepID=UPI001EF65070|nr:hypothetical protein [Candidatus Nitrotoga sp. M5]CAH1387148.1 conserved hypothetical protein [Candidatus Nitrotoga sp. M5]